MITFEDLQRYLRPVTQAIQRVVARAVIEAITNTGATQTLKALIMADELAEDVEHVEEYGFTSYAKAGAEALLVSAGGQHERAVAVHVGDRRYRPVDLNEGDTQVYRYTNAAGTPHRIWLRETGGVLEITVEGDMILLGNEAAVEPVVLGNLMTTLYNAHTHATGTGPSGPPVVLMTAAQVATKVKAI